VTGLLAAWASAASGHAARVDTLMAAFSLMVALLAAPVFILMAVFAVKYRRGRAADRRHPPTRNTWIEISWSAVPFVLMIVFYVWATRLFFDLHHPPPGALEINVVAKQWMWKFQHPTGQQEIDEVHVPAGEPVVFTMASQDVIHSLFVPALRLKQDLVPGRYTTMWFTADRPGSYALTCAEFCGANHSIMGGRLVVLPQADYARWLRESGVDKSLAAQGAVLFRAYGCSGCHGPSSTVRAPALEGIYGSPVPLQDGSVVTADDQYIRDSILLPQSQVAAGYAPVMPTFRNVLGEDDVQRLVAYIKSLGRGKRSGND
jgi:cytochrome c oxidase subunit 2